MCVHLSLCMPVLQAGSNFLLFFFFFKRERLRTNNRNQFKAYVGSTYELAQGQCLLAQGLIGVLYCTSGTKDAWPNEWDLDGTWQLEGFVFSSCSRRKQDFQTLFSAFYYVKSVTRGWDVHFQNVTFCVSCKLYLCIFLKRLTSRVQGTDISVHLQMYSS